MRQECQAFLFFDLPVQYTHLQAQTLSGLTSLANVTQGIHLANPHLNCVGLTSIDKQMTDAEDSAHSDTQHVPKY